MNTESIQTNISTASGTGVAKLISSEKSRVDNQGKALAEEMLSRKSGVVEGSTITPTSPEASGENSAGKQVVAQLNSYVQNIQRNLEFRIDEATSRTVISVIDRDSKEVIRQIPSDIVLKLAQQLSSMNERSGMLLEDKA